MVREGAGKGYAGCVVSIIPVASAAPLLLAGRCVQWSLVLMCWCKLDSRAKIVQPAVPKHLPPTTPPRPTRPYIPELLPKFVNLFAESDRCGTYDMVKPALATLEVRLQACRQSCRLGGWQTGVRHACRQAGRQAGEVCRLACKRHVSDGV